MDTRRYVQEAMTSPDEVRALLAARDIGRLPVVDGRGVLIGIVSRRDLLRAFVPGDAETRHRVIDRVTDAGGEVYAVTVSGGAVWIRGRMERRAEIPVLEQTLLQTPGVTSVVLEFGCRVDDTADATATAEAG